MSLQVLCPFCLKEKHFRKTTPDLRDHVLREHKRDVDRLGSLKNDLFTESNGFWFSFVPHEYRQYTEPSDPKSSCASAARDLVRNWLAKVRESSRSIHDWERGWKLAEEGKSRVSGKRNTERPLLMDINGASEHVDQSEPCVKINKSDAYSPRRPAITRDQLVIHSIYDTVDGISALLYTEGQCQIWYRCILAKEITSDPRSYVNIVHKKAALKQNYNEPPTSMKEVNTNHLRMKDTIATTLGIPSRLVAKVTYGIKLYQPSKNQASRTYSPTIMTPLHDLWEEDNHPMPDSHIRSPVMLNTSSRTGMDNGDEVMLSDLDELLENDAESRGEYRGNTFLRPDDVKTEFTSETSTSELATETGSSVDSGYFDLGKEKHLSEVIMHSTNKQSHQSPAKYENDGEVIVLDTTIPATHSRKTALEFLSTGVMPIIPPAKREWTDVRPLALLTDPQPLYWPPKDWENLSPDARLFAWEMAAFRLHTSGRQPKPLDWDRVSVLTIYNMLALPGTANLSVEEPRREETEVRLCNFNMMKKIVLHGTKSQTERMFLRMMEQASVHRERSTDWLTTLLDAHNVRLRLTK